MNDITNFLSSLTEEILIKNNLKKISLLNEKNLEPRLIIEMINGYSSIIDGEHNIKIFINKFTL
jgi:hypothetical protein